MKKLILISLLILVFSKSFSQIIDFIDPQFKQKLIVLGVDTDGDYEISSEEAEGVSSLDLSDGFHNIRDISGIEYFSNLDTMSCEFQSVEAVNLNKNIKIRYLNLLGSDDLDSLAIDSLTNLEYLNVIQTGNKIDSLDLSTFSLLRELHIERKLKLDVSQNPALEVLTADHIPDLDVSQNLNLKWLSVNGASSVNITQNIDLEYFNSIGIYENEAASLKELNVSKNTKLKILRCPQNLIKQIDLSKNTELEQLWIGTNPLEILDISNNRKLTILSCAQIGLDSLNLSNNQELKHLSCFTNNIVQLDLTNNPKLVSLNCHNNNMEYLDVSNCVLLEHLDCMENNLKYLDISKSPKLDFIQITYNPLLHTVCVWELPFPPEGIGWISDGGCPLLEYKDCTLNTIDKNLPSNLIYPNPAHDYIVIKSDDISDIGLVEIYDIAGTVVLTYQATQLAREYRIGIEELSEGFYVVRFRQKEKYQVQRFVKR